MRGLPIRAALLLAPLVIGCRAHPHSSGTADSAQTGPGEPPAPAPGTILGDDSTLTVDGTTIDSKRQAILTYLWGAPSLPAGMPTIEKSYGSPIPDLVNVKRVDRLTLAMDGGETGESLHFVPQSANGHLVIVSLGHLCTFDDGDPGSPPTDFGPGHYRVLAALLQEGYAVLATYMPHMRPQQCADIDHNALIQHPVATGHPVKWFLEPIAVALNYLLAAGNAAAEDFPPYADVSMLGLSGGGWTTTMYAAIDPRIHLSMPIAGSVPLNLRTGQSTGDAEQTLPELYAIAGYPDLYVLGASGGRRQIQVLNRNDDCCFGQAEGEYDADAHGPWDRSMRAVENQVQARLHSLDGHKGGSFRLEIDEAPDHHEISSNTVATTILSELDNGVRSVGAASASQAFVRNNGTLWRWSGGAWNDTGLAMVGAPAVVEPTATSPLEVFYRSPSNVLTEASYDPASAVWTERSLAMVVLADPVAARAPDDTVTVATVLPDYTPIVWPAGIHGPPQTIGAPLTVVGSPAVVPGPAVQLYFRGLDRQLHLIETADSSAPSWSQTTLGGALLGFPTAVRTSDGASRVYVRDDSAAALLEVYRTGQPGATWVKNEVTAPLPPATGSGQPDTLAGSPSVSIDSGNLRVHAMTQSGQLVSFTPADSAWSATAITGHISGAPVSVGAQAFGGTDDARLWMSDGVAIHRLGRPVASAAPPPATLP
jgi:hypothetical protein